MKDVDPSEIDVLLEHDEDYAQAREKVLRRLRFELLARTHVDAF